MGYRILGFTKKLRVYRSLYAGNAEAIAAIVDRLWKHPKVVKVVIYRQAEDS